MKLKKKVKKILDKYVLDIHVPKNIYKMDPLPKDMNPEKTDAILRNKYKKNIPEGWYGFDLGKPTPNVWIEAIDEILKMLIKKDKNLAIHQIKMKYGGIRFYVGSSSIKDMADIEDLIEDSMYNENLIY